MLYIAMANDRLRIECDSIMDAHQLRNELDRLHKGYVDRMHTTVYTDAPKRVVLFAIDGLGIIAAIHKEATISAKHILKLATLFKNAVMSPNLSSANAAIDQAEKYMKQLRDLQSANSLPADRNKLYSELSRMEVDLRTQILPVIQSGADPQSKELARQANETCKRLVVWMGIVNKQH
jgi:hypothetical protein